MRSIQILVITNQKKFPHPRAARAIRYIEINQTKDKNELYGINYKNILKDIQNT